MFYKMINTARDRWYDSANCTVNPLIDYIIHKEQMRDAQIEAIKTYLFLKIACLNKPLAFLFKQGAFNTLNLSDLELSVSTRAFLDNHPAAAALLEYAQLKNDVGEQVSEKIEKQIKKFPESIDYNKFFSDAFYGVTYTDYLFSLPMGAGKTYLMAAFIYLDLYFAMNEPANSAFAHNFIIFAPSGLKSSVVPSLRTIQKFDPAWIIPEPSATTIKRKVLFEVLDQNKTANKSNKTKNPNVQKIANHQPLSELFGLVAVTNAEKVILDRIQEKNGQVTLFEESDDEKDRMANELRNLIGKLPSLSIFIDEVHHAVSDEIKLRAVVNKWSESKTVNSVVGFSGTPYLEKAESIKITEKLSIASAEISNIVYYYPLINGVGNFLKKPIVKISDIIDSAQIVEAGVREFLDTYIDTVYDGGLVAKLGIYCGTIEKLEQMVFPLVARIIAEYGLPIDSILKFHKGNKEYPQPADSQLQFDILDKAISNIRIVLLVQIGKEGWDCRSLTGIILSQEGDCPKNMVLQTSCRCLRQVVKNASETALIYLNESNAEKLNAQLEQQHHISLKEFSSANNSKAEIKRYDRTAYLKLPPVRFYQLKVQFETLTLEQARPDEKIPIAAMNAEITHTIKTQDFALKVTNIAIDSKERGDGFASFTAWLYTIAKSSFGFITMKQLKAQTGVLQDVFDTITYNNGGVRCFSSKYARTLIEANIRKAFYEKRGFTTKEELIPQEARLLNIDNFTTYVNTDKPTDYYPEQSVVENIILEDNGKLKMDKKTQQLIQLAEETGNVNFAEQIMKKYSSHPERMYSYHYLPYKTDSTFERTFLSEVLVFDDIEKLGLEVYYNGDRALTEFKIRCYKQSGGRWQYIGMYTPDFLIIQRKAGQIHKAVIVETKGKIYANDPTFIDKRKFMETQFTKQNNDAFGYDRFEYLYLEDTLPEKERIVRTHNAITSFFKEEDANA
jgi:type III restriction enzyme